MAAEKQMKEESAPVERANPTPEPQASMRRAVAAHVEGRLEAAEKSYRDAASSGDPDAAYQLGWLLQDRGEYAEAALAFEQANRGNVDALVPLANLLADHLNRQEDAIELYENAIARGSVDAVLYLGLLYASEGKLDRAERAFCQAAAAGSGDAHRELGELLVEAGRYEEALESLRNAVARGIPNSWSWVGLALSRMHRHDEAEVALKRAVEEGEPDGLRLLGHLMHSCLRLEDAEQSYRSAIDHGDQSAWLLYADLLDDWAGREAEALAAYEKALEVGDEQAHYELAQLHRRLGNLDLAEREFRAALASGDDRATAGLRSLLAERGGTSGLEGELPEH